VGRGSLVCLARSAATAQRCAVVCVALAVGCTQGTVPLRLQTLWGMDPRPLLFVPVPYYFIVGCTERGVRGAVPSAAAQAGFLQHLPHVLQQLCAGSRVSWRGRSASVRDIQWPAAGRAC
jgi:hypothetical protein